MKEKLVAIALMAAVAITMIPAGLVLCSDVTHAADSYSYTVKKPTVTINGKKVHVATFTVSGKGLKGTCCQAGATAKSGKTTVKKLKNTDIRAKLIYYYGYKKGYLGKPNRNGFLLGRALSWSSGNTTTWPLSSAEIKSFIKAMPSSVTVPDRFECYFCNPSNGSQNFIAYKINPPVYITLQKISTDAFATAAGSGYNFEGIEYTVYKSNGKKVGKLTCKSNGKTNKLTLDTGKYKVKETKTNQWYKLNSKVYTKTLKAGQTWTIAAEDGPATGTVHIRKNVKGSYSGNLAFDFKLTNTANTNITYTVRTNAETGEASINVIQGTYRCEEILPDGSNLIDITGPQTAKIEIGETYTFERENKELSPGTLQIAKTTNDGASPKGFRFKVSGVLFNQGHLTAEEIIDAANPVLSDYDKNIFEEGEWEISEDDLEELNNAAADRKTGSRTLALCNTLQRTTEEESVELSEFVEALTADDDEGTIEKGTLLRDDDIVFKALEDIAFEVVFEESSDESEEADEETETSEAKTIDTDETAESIRKLLTGDGFEEIDVSDIEVSVDVKVDLRPVEYVYYSSEPEASGYETDTDKQIKNKKEKIIDRGQYKLTYNSFDWYGAATPYQEIKKGSLTGGTTVYLETEADGSAPAIEEGITYGRFTVEEIMTDDQKKRYRQPESQTKVIEQNDGKAAFAFCFENKARWTDTELLKTSSDGNISGITFRLEGTDSRGEDIKLDAVTNEDGRIDFGKLYAGEYVISEADFDPKKYENNYRLEGYDVPAQKVVITGDETENITVQFENVPLKSLYLTKVDKESQSFLKNAVFSLSEGDKQLALFRIVLDEYGQAGIDMISCDEDSGIKTGIPQMGEFSDSEEADTNNLTDEESEETGDEFESVPDDGEITIIEPDTDSDSEADEEKEEDETYEEDVSDEEDDAAETSGEENTEADSSEYNFAVIRGLKEGKTYTLKEITAPSGYAAGINYSFEFEDGQKLVLENNAPAIATLALDKSTNMHMSNAEGKVTIVDTVSYSNLGPGHTYLLSGVLAYKHDESRTVDEIEQDAESIEIVKDAKGNEVTAQKEFVPESENGIVDIEFSFDASLLDGKQVVAMEQLVDPALTGINGVITVVASHEDIEDESQSIYFPEVKTKAIADDTGKQITEADGEVLITDTVEYTNVIRGKIYEITGTLMDKDTGEPLISNDAPVTSTVRFRADQSGPVLTEGEEESEESPEEECELVSGKLELKFSFDGSDFAGKRAVAFEKLTTGGCLVGEHSDINDEEQTVSLPTIKTTATTNGSDKVSDKVIYTNLIAGEKYIMRGVLMDKGTGEELQLNGNSVTAQMEFVPTESNGTITMDFPIDHKEIAGKTAVVFETCSVTVESEEGQSEIEVISHKDINNKAQTVSFNTPQTGQTEPWKLLIPSGFATGVGIGMVLRRLRKARWI